MVAQTPKENMPYKWVQQLLISALCSQAYTFLSDEEEYYHLEACQK